MTQDDLYQHIFDSRMFTQWHWFRWHFEHRLRGGNHPFAESIVNACLDCNARIPEFGKGFINELSAISGREKWDPHWEQLNQKLSELLIIRQVVTYEWPPETTYIWEKEIAGGGEKPELIIQTEKMTFGIEVKAPAIFKHHRHRAGNPIQAISRTFQKDSLNRLTVSGDAVTLPRDNPVKDFLVSANSKFEPFKKMGSPSFIGVLVIVWDDFINEPLSALIHPDSGLLTAKSFAKNSNNLPLLFPFVDGIVLVRHLHQFIKASRDELLSDGCIHALYYGRPNKFPYKAFIKNPTGEEVSNVILECLQALPPKAEMGAEYVPMDLVVWS